MIRPYWRENRDAPFATMLSTIDHYCHPEAHAEAFDELIELTRRPEPPDWVRRFKEELRTAVSGNREGIHPQAISVAAEYDDGSDDAYLRRLWSELYPDEPIPAPPTSWHPKAADM